MQFPEDCGEGRCGYLSGSQGFRDPFPMPAEPRNRGR